MSILTWAAILYKSKTLSNGEHPIMIRIYDGSKRKYLATGYSCSEQMWDKKNSLPKKSHLYYDDVVTIVQNKLAQVSHMKTINEISDTKSSSNEVVDRLVKGKRSKTTILKFFAEYEQELFDKKQTTYSGTFRYAKNTLYKFLMGEDCKFTDFDLSKLKEYESYLKKNLKKTTSQSVYLRTFRTLFRVAIQRKLCPEGHYPFKEFNFSEYNDPETKGRAIGKKELKKIFDLKLPDEGSEFLSRQLFKFSYFANGINFIDMALLRWSDISKDSIDYVRSKTGKPMTISITKTTRQLLNYFRTMKYDGPTSYVFPILSKEYGDTPKEQKAKYNRIGDKRSDYNDDLRKLAKKAKIDINITSYVARHSFAFNAFTNDVGKQYIGQALGHSLEKQTNKYIGKLDHKKIANKIEQALT